MNITYWNCSLTYKTKQRILNRIHVCSNIGCEKANLSFSYWILSTLVGFSENLWHSFNWNVQTVSTYVWDLVFVPSSTFTLNFHPIWYFPSSHVLFHSLFSPLTITSVSSTIDSHYRRLTFEGLIYCCAMWWISRKFPWMCRADSHKQLNQFVFVKS